MGGGNATSTRSSPVESLMELVKEPQYVHADSFCLCKDWYVISGGMQDFNYVYSNVRMYCSVWKSNLV